MEGWIKIHRQIKENWIWDNPLYLKAWIGILLTVNHEDNKVLIEGELIECKRGQSLLSLFGWSKLFGKTWTIQRVRTFFRLLKNDAMIEVEGLRKTTRVTVCNYDTYQEQQQTNNKEITDKQQGDNNKQEGLRRIKNEKNIIPPTMEMVSNYCTERQNKINAPAFFDFYETRGWIVGKIKMKDWQAAIRTWEKNDFGKQNEQPIISYKTIQRNVI
jgi:hypothetical protein